MGMLAVIELARKIEADEMTLTDAIRQHLATGFFKSVQEKWIPVCVGVIERYRGGDTDLSYGVNVPDKPTDCTVLVESIVENLHLEPFMGEAGG